MISCGGGNGLEHIDVDKFRMEETDKLPKAELLVENLLIEYKGWNL